MSKNQGKRHGGTPIKEGVLGRGASDKVQGKEKLLRDGVFQG